MTDDDSAARSNGAYSGVAGEAAATSAKGASLASLARCCVDPNLLASRCTACPEGEQDDG